MDVDRQQHRPCVLIGTAFCDWKGKWNVLEELAGEVSPYPAVMDGHILNVY